MSREPCCSTQRESVAAFRPVRFFRQTADEAATIIASVVPEATFNLMRLCQRYFASEPLMVGRPDCLLGIGIDVDMPKEEGGADRITTAVADQDRDRPPLMVIDFGTATTFDIVDRLGNYCGGVIAPG